MSLYERGSGAPEDPYIITNIHQFKNIEQNPTAHFKQEGDIELTTWGESCMDPDVIFSGTYDGNFYRVRGGLRYMYRSLFPRLQYPCVIKNMIFEGREDFWQTGKFAMYSGTYSILAHEIVAKEGALNNQTVKIHDIHFTCTSYDEGMPETGLTQILFSGGGVGVIARTARAPYALRNISIVGQIRRYGSYAPDFLTIDMTDEQKKYSSVQDFHSHVVFVNDGAHTDGTHGTRMRDFSLLPAPINMRRCSFLGEVRRGGTTTSLTDNVNILNRGALYDRYEFDGVFDYHQAKDCYAHLKVRTKSNTRRSFQLRLGYPHDSGPRRSEMLFLIYPFENFKIVIENEGNTNMNLFDFPGATSTTQWSSGDAQEFISKHALARISLSLPDGESGRMDVGGANQFDVLRNPVMMKKIHMLTTKPSSNSWAGPMLLGSEPLISNPYTKFDSSTRVEPNISGWYGKIQLIRYSHTFRIGHLDASGNIRNTVGSSHGHPEGGRVDVAMGVFDPEGKAYTYALPYPLEKAPIRPVPIRTGPHDIGHSAYAPTLEPRGPKAFAVLGQATGPYTEIRLYRRPEYRKEHGSSFASGNTVHYQQVLTSSIEADITQVILDNGPGHYTARARSYNKDGEGKRIFEGGWSLWSLDRNNYLHIMRYPKMLPPTVNKDTLEVEWTGENEGLDWGDEYPVELGEVIHKDPKSVIVRLYEAESEELISKDVAEGSGE